nr:hypothetical protein [Tanacetum cinerariifolium]GEZ22851.1 hypothetical protein [Tanacetum cinerariifolium]
GKEVFVSQEVPLKEVNVAAAATTTTAIIDDITLAKALMEIKSEKPKADKVVIQEPEQGTTTTTLTITTIATTITAASTRPKAKVLVIHEQEKAPTLTVSSQHPHRSRFRTRAKAKWLNQNLEKAQKIIEVNIAWDDIQAKIDADYQLAQRLQAEEQKELTDKEKPRLFVQFLKKRRKFFAAKRAEEKRNRPPTKAQQKSIMCTYLKNIEGWKPKSLKNKTELVVESSNKAKAEVREGSPKRAKEELEQENAKKQKMEDDKESAELKQCLEIIPKDGDDVRFLMLLAAEGCRLKMIRQERFITDAKKGRIMKELGARNESVQKDRQLMLLVYKVTTSFIKVNAVSSNVTTAQS